MEGWALTQAQGKEIKGLQVCEEASLGQWRSDWEYHGKRPKTEAGKVCQEIIKQFALLGRVLKAVVGHGVGRGAGGVVTENRARGAGLILQQHSPKLGLQNNTPENCY